MKEDDLQIPLAILLVVPLLWLEKVVSLIVTAPTMAVSTGRPAIINKPMPTIIFVHLIMTVGIEVV